MAAKVNYNGTEVGEFLVDGENNYMGIEWNVSGMALEESVRVKIADKIENGLPESNTAPISTQSISSSDLGL